jgi:hypothetical protein
MDAESVSYYDNSAEYDPHGSRYVDRVYCFATEEFTDRDWDVLRRAYDSMPPGLGASLEPPGIQVTGIATDDDLNDWHLRFLAATCTLPRKQVDR